MTNLPEIKPNSHRYKEMKRQQAEGGGVERKKVEKVVNGPVKVRKKTELSTFKDAFISEDASNLKTYLVGDVFIPALKKTIQDIVTIGIDILLNGKNGSTTRKRTTADRVSYRSFYDDRRDDRPRLGSTITPYRFDEITFTTRGEAEEVLIRMEELVDTYGVATVADFYDLVGISGAYTDNRYGWMSMRGVDVTRVLDGYRLTLPKAMPIN